MRIRVAKAKTYDGDLGEWDVFAVFWRACKLLLSHGFDQDLSEEIACIVDGISISVHRKSAANTMAAAVLSFETSCCSGLSGLGYKLKNSASGR